MLYKFKYSIGLCLFLTYLSFATCFADNLPPKTLLITCATGELGSATAKQLARDHQLILTGRNLTKLQQLQTELKSLYPLRYEICALDYSSEKSIADLKHQLKLLNMPLSGVVLVTPRPQFYGKELLQEQQQWLDVIQLTFTGPLEVLKTALPHLSHGAKIVIVAGTTSVQFQPEAGPACVIRRMWTTSIKALAHQLGAQGISVNALSPGVVLTEYHQKRIHNKAREHGLTYEEELAEEVSHIPLQRHAQPQDVAQSVRFLVTEDSGFINGVNLILDGGFTTAY